MQIAEYGTQVLKLPFDLEKNMRKHSEKYSFDIFTPVHFLTVIHAVLVGSQPISPTMKK
jgi:hypothetical protein